MRLFQIEVGSLYSIVTETIIFHQTFLKYIAESYFSVRMSKEINILPKIYAQHVMVIPIIVLGWVWSKLAVLHSG